MNKKETKDLENLRRMTSNKNIKSLYTIETKEKT